MGEAKLGHDDLLADGREALRQGAWAEARNRFQRAVALSETADALEGLGAAAWWQNDAPVALAARERAYALYLKSGDRKSAALPVIPPGDLERIAVPTTLIWGRHDRQVRLRIAQAASARHGWPLHLIEDAAGDPAFEQPEATLRVLRSALGGSR